MTDVENDDRYRIMQELKKMDFIYDTQPFGSPRPTEPPRFFVNFHQDVEEMPREFDTWMRENDLAIAAAHINTVDAGTTLALELQFVSEL